MDDGTLKKEDYIEPRCPLCEEPYGAEPAVKPVPQQRIIEKMNEYMSRRDYAGAERHLLYWLEEAKLGQDLRGQLMLRNELVGHYRKTAEREKAFENAEAALQLVEAMDFDGTISSGTTYVNCATAFNAFGENERAAALFAKARKVYEAAPQTRPELLGGLYNNMALTCAALRRFDEARGLYALAMEQMGRVPGGCLEQAITCLNIANLIEDERGLEEGEGEIFDLLDRAYELLDPKDERPGDAPRDGYYAFVCEKCAPTFSYYGYFAAAEELERRSEELYAKYGRE